MNNSANKINPLELNCLANIKLSAMARVLPQRHEWAALIEAKNEN